MPGFLGGVIAANIFNGIGVGGTAPALTLSGASFAPGKFNSGLAAGTATAMIAIPGIARGVGFWLHKASVAAYVTFLQLTGFVSFGTGDSSRIESDSNGSTPPGISPPSTSYFPTDLLTSGDHYIYYDVASDGSCNLYANGTGQTSGSASLSAGNCTINLDTSRLGGSTVISDLCVWGTSNTGRAPPPTAPLVPGANMIALWPLNGSATSLV